MMYGKFHLKRAAVFSSIFANKAKESIRKLSTAYSENSIPAYYENGFQ
jgi:hypothetical protein